MGLAETLDRIVERGTHHPSTLFDVLGASMKQGPRRGYGPANTPGSSRVDQHGRRAEWEACHPGTWTDRP